MTKTATVREINESNHYFHSADWKFNGSKIVAICGRDKSTEEQYRNAQAGSILLVISEIRPGWTTGKQKKVWALSDDVVST